MREQRLRGGVIKLIHSEREIQRRARRARKCNNLRRGSSCYLITLHQLN